MSPDSFTVIEFDPDTSRRPAPSCGQGTVPEKGLSISSLKDVIRQLKQDEQDISKEELQELCLYLGKKLLSRERAVIALNNRVNNLQMTIGKLTRKKRG